MRRNSRVLLIPGLLLLLAGSAGAADIYVPGDQPTIQAGIDAASNGDSVIVDPGTYLENVVWDGKDLQVIGAGPGSTLVNGDVDGDGVGNGPCFEIRNGVPDTAVLTGFTLTNGAAPAGGGLYVHDGCSLTVSNNEIVNNWADLRGGGVSLVESDVLLDSNWILFNTSGDLGGGIAAEGGELALFYNAVGGNSAYFGGGCYLGGSTADLDYNLVLGNRAQYDSDSGYGGAGGGVYLNGSTALLLENSVTANEAGLYGGGIYAYTSAVGLYGNDVDYNLADDPEGLGGGMFLDSSLADLASNWINRNEAGTAGGGMFLHSTTATQTFDSVTGNDTDGWGGGMYVYNSDVGLISNAIWDNGAYAYGGGIHLDSSIGTVSLNFIGDNWAQYGGAGVMLYGSPVALNDNWIGYNNAFLNMGGGILAYSDGGATLDGNWIEDNFAYLGGGMALEGSAATVTNSVIVNNAATEEGGGVYDSSSTATLTNNTIADNWPDGVVGNGSSSAITNSILWGNWDVDVVGLAPTYSDIGVPGTLGDPTNISVDPLFVGGGDYHLQPTSPCINKGNNGAPSLPDTDWDGDPRILPDAAVGGSVDMGADEVTTGRIFGKVTDKKTGKPVKEAKVKLLDSAGKEVGEQKTDKKGNYEFPNLVADNYTLEVTSKPYSPATVKGLLVPPDQEVNVALVKKGHSRASIAWVVPPQPRLAAGTSQTVRWRVTGEEVTGTALVGSTSGDPTALAAVTTAGMEVAPGEYKATIRAVSPGKWHYAAVAEVDGETVATKPVAVVAK
jgi:hypothetical protein